MANSNKRKGDKAELEVQALWRDHTGVPARRALGAGRRDDIGDIHGVPYTTIQVVDTTDKTRAITRKPVDCEAQRARANKTFAATFVRLFGGDYRVVLTPEQFFTYWREATDIKRCGTPKGQTCEVCVGSCEDFEAEAA